MTRTKNDTNAPRVYHGGSWYDVDPSWVRAASRDTYGPAFRGSLIGFRTSLPARQPR
jgi:formylglycine-generating enzyme required for sulfatase activity